MSKKNAKSQEELLKEALVPVEEQPYEVPENWIWTYIESVMIQEKNRAEAVQQRNYLDDGEIPIIDQGQKFIAGFTNDSEYSFTGILPVIIFGDHTKCIKWVDFDFAQGADGTKVLKAAHSMVDNKFLYYFLRSVKLPNKGYSRHFKFLKEVKVPLPPLNEQKRIADKVERLLDKINQAKQLIEEAKETFELRRAAILDKAFRGELTKKWREESGHIDAEWQIVDLDQIASAIDPEPSHRTPSRYEGGIPYIGIKECDYDSEKIDFAGSRPVKPEVLEEHIQRYTINDGDFIIGKIGTVGKPFIIPTIRNFVLSANVILIQPMKDKIHSKYLFYLFNSPIIEDQLTAGINATTQAAFGIKKARKLSIPICSFAEQEEIVRLLEIVFHKEKKTMELLGLQLDELTKSILSKAFKGELGTNLKAEENEVFRVN